MRVGNLPIKRYLSLRASAKRTIKGKQVAPLTSGILALEDGTIWHGISFGAIGDRTGEIVFNTSMTVIIFG